MRLFRNTANKQTSSAHADDGVVDVREQVDAAPPGDAAATVNTDDVLDTLASVLRAIGKHAFEIENRDPAEFLAQCDAWAKHVLTGSAVPSDAEDADDQALQAPHSERRQWSGVRRFVVDVRKDEQAYVNSRLGQFRSVLGDLVSNLRQLSVGGSDSQKTIDGNLAHLEHAVRNDSIESLRAEVSQAVSHIRTAIEQERQQLSDQLRSMGSKIATLRAELLEAKRKMELDPLTQLYNRGALDDALERYVDLASLTAQPLLFLMVDLDHFKQVNDRYGHPVGDEVLVALSNTLVRCFPRGTDFISRYGGEEFALILWDVEQAQVSNLCGRLLNAVRDLEIPIPSGDDTIKVTCSIGAASLCDNDTRQSLVTRADQALYEAKHGGRDQAVIAPSTTSPR